MYRSIVLFISAGVGVILANASAVGTEGSVSPLAISISPATAAPTALTSSGQSVPLAAGAGGFSVQDFNAHAEVVLRGGKVDRKGGIQTFTAESDDLRIHADFTPENAVIHVTGEIESKRPAERALIVRYLLPVATANASIESEISKPEPINADTNVLGTVYPLGVITNAKWGVALSIPPTAPVCFGITGSKAGLGIEFYLGLSPLTKAFPNRARFDFVIDSAQPGWGFRSALAQYYARYPQFYSQRFQHGGFWNWQETGPIEHALPLFRFQGIPSTPELPKIIERNRKFDLLTFEYLIVGQREIRNLSELPDDYAGWLAALQTFKEKWASDSTGEIRKPYPGWVGQNIPEEIELCAVTNADGRYRIRARATTWGKNSITFTMNPNPGLFADKQAQTVGAVTLDLVRNWYAKHDIDGVMVDSLGNQWPSTLNFRRDHFPYARYPLTFDAEGRVALHNQLSHYEFVDALRKLSDENHKFLFANGVARYTSETGENYHGTEAGRFFLASQLDAAGREITAILDRSQLEFFRTAMGPKLYTALLYKWNDPGEVHRQMNRALAFDVFAGPIRCFLDNISYLKSKDGYERDKDFLEWFTKLARLLHDAKWQPVTYAQTSVPDVVVERYGSGDVFYFTLLNLGAKPLDTEVSIDLAALHISPKNGEMAHVREIAQGVKVVDTTEDETSKVKVHLNPDETQILKLTRAW